MKRRTFIQSAAWAGVGTNFAVSPKPEKALIFLFQGDSITDGNRGRSLDPNHIMGHGYAYSVASRIGADFPEAGFTFYNRGISGNKITDLQKRWETDTLNLKPDVLSILIGINDTNAVINKSAEASTVAEFENIYRSLLTASRSANPDILFVLGIPFVYPVGKRAEQWEQWREDTNNRQAVVRKLAGEFDAVVVDYPAVFDKAMKKAPTEYWIWDGIHPTVFAHELMAREWMKQVGKRLRFLK
ncbi:SGNH/GDSL hydrolase family protein [Runella sp.]|uniref:SGNH/GDSL hydrolase family protein n=1 Tax=Runella sp. TaxID=1960881 RepID=UPI003D0A6F24